MQAGAIHPVQGITQLKHKSRLRLMDSKKALATHHNDQQQHDDSRQRIGTHYFLSNALGATGAPRLGRFR